MRILQVTPYFSPAYSYGGPPETVHKLSKALVHRGHQVTVLTTDAFSARARQPERHTTNGLDVYYLRNLSNYLAWRYQLFLPISTGRFLRKHASDFDVIHLHSFRTLQNFSVHRMATEAKTPYVFSAHGSVPRIVRMKLAKRVFDSLVGRDVLKDAAALIAVSKAERRQYEDAGVPASKITVIPNGIDAEQYADLPPRGEFARRHHLEGRRIVSYVGRLHSRKGLDTLIRAMRALCDTRDDVALALVGPDDGYRSHLVKMLRQLSLQDNVLLTGLITLPLKLGVYVDSDVVVYPGSFEIFGLVPFEALLCGRPVIVADDSGCGELITESGGGLTVPFGNSTKLQEAIEYLLEDPEKMKAMAERGRRYVLERLDWARIAAETEAVYRRAAISNEQRTVLDFGS